jgi:hypothetical protein
MLFIRIRLWLFVLFWVAAVGLAACSPSGAGGDEPDVETPEAGHGAGEEHEEGAVDHSASRIPNDGAAIRIVSPADGEVFGVADEVLVAVETENFDLAAEGNHWHVYVDGVSYGMITGGDADHALRNLEPGEREISVYLSVGSHEELEEGDVVVIQVESGR